MCLFDTVHLALARLGSSWMVSCEFVRLRMFKSGGVGSEDRHSRPLHMFSGGRCCVSAPPRENTVVSTLLTHPVLLAARGFSTSHPIK